MSKKTLCFLVFGAIGVCLAQYSKESRNGGICLNLNAVLDDSSTLDSSSEERSASSDSLEDEGKKRPLWRCYSLKKRRRCNYSNHRRQSSANNNGEGSRRPGRPGDTPRVSPPPIPLRPHIMQNGYWGRQRGQSPQSSTTRGPPHRLNHG